MNHNKTRMIAEGGMAIAIAFVLNFIVLFHMPQGGSVKAASMVPLMFYAYRWGGKSGLTVSIVYGIVDFLLGFKYTIHSLSILLDYIVGYGIIGICGYFKDTTIGLFSGSLLAMVLRWCSTVVSGAVVFASYAPEGQNPWIYSMIYNASYMIPNAIINIAVLMIVYKALKKGIKSV